MGRKRGKREGRMEKSRTEERNDGKKNRKTGWEEGR